METNPISFAHPHPESVWWYLFGCGQAVDHWAYQTSAPRQSATVCRYTSVTWLTPGEFPVIVYNIAVRVAHEDEQVQQRFSTRLKMRYEVK